MRSMRLAPGCVQILELSAGAGASDPNSRTITETAAAAGVSHRTFYSYFSSKQECFFDAYDQIAGHLREAMNAAGDQQPEWPERVRAELGALLAANPDLPRFCGSPPSGGAASSPPATASSSRSSPPSSSPGIRYRPPPADPQPPPCTVSSVASRR
jgi:hypothetical protein